VFEIHEAFTATIWHSNRTSDP